MDHKKLSYFIIIAYLSLLQVIIIDAQKQKDSKSDFLSNGLNKLRGRLGNGLNNLTDQFKKSSNFGYLDAHNKARKQVGLDPLKWDNNLAAYAENYSKRRQQDCAMVHSNGPYGENLAWFSSKASGREAVEMWIEEKAFYDYSSNTCDEGKVCGHYTQIVWANSKRLGCAKTQCGSGGKETFIICSYDPPGNYEDEKPY